jgi:Asp-tRNA(Asn)/Glu-tRNA(Gln) amidotransferase A subunit family amidase
MRPDLSRRRAILEWWPLRLPAVVFAEARTRVREFGTLNAFISETTEDGAGLVVAVKDIVDVKGLPTTGGSDVPGDEVAADDAQLITNVRSRGCNVIGKTNLDEWGLGVSGANPHFGNVRNPRDRSRMSGGSSAGSAVAVAVGACDWAVGTDSGGSVRIPASLCGIVGFKPTPGVIPTRGVIALSPSLDTVGALAPNVGIASAAIWAMAGKTASIEAPEAGLSVYRLAVPQGWIGELDAPTSSVWRAVSAELPEIRFPSRERLAAAATTILLAEAAVEHRSRIASFPDRYGEDAKERIRLGQMITTVDYLRAIEEREQLRYEVEAAMRGWDALVTPATTCVAPLIGTPRVRDALSWFTRPFNLTGQPAVVVPGRAANLPVGLQLVGHPDGDRDLARIAMAFEQRWGPTGSRAVEPAAFTTSSRG